MISTRRAALLGAGAAAFAGSMFAGGALAQSTTIAGLVDQVDGRALRAHVFGLSSFPTRWTEHPDFGAVETWIADAFGPTATRQPFALPGGKIRHNIVVRAPSDPRDIVLVGGHFDSISENPATEAPGANDNATGIAALLEAHRILSPLLLDKQIVFIGFAGEEQGLIGSTAAAEIAAREGWPIDLMLNLDMLGHRPPRATDPMVIEYDQGNATAGNDAAARTFGQEAARLAQAHTTLATSHTDIWDSDYMPFEARGFPCIGLFDGGNEGAVYHTTRDTPDRVDYARLEQATRLTVAILAHAAGVAS